MSFVEICVTAMACFGLICFAIFALAMTYLACMAFSYLTKWSKWPLFVWLRRRAANKRARTGYWSKIKVRKNDPAAR